MALGLLRDMASGAAPAVERAAETAENVIVGKYEILEEMGASPVGTTHKVRHALLDTVLSMTVLSPEVSGDPHRLGLVQAAVQQACRLRHEHIAPVLDFGQDASGCHVVEAFPDGEPLDQLLREHGPLSPLEALQVARQLADALAHAHEHHVVHGAITPSSVRIRREAASTGSARAILSGFATTPVAEVPLAYSAPERLAGAERDARGDVFALGLLIFEMFEGKPFFSGTPEETRNRLVADTAPLLPQFSHLVPTGVSGLVGRAIRRAPAHRPQSMMQLREEIDTCLRRIGETNIRAARAVAVRRRAAVVVDEALEEPPAEMEEVQEPIRSAAPPRRVVSRSGRRAGVGMAIAVAGAALVVFSPLFPRHRVEPVVPAVEVVPAEPEAAPVVPEATAPPAIEAPEDAAVPEPALPPADIAEPEAEPAPVAVVASPPPAVDAARAPGRNVAPRIVSQRPRGRGPIGILEGQAVAFSVRAVDVDHDRLAYVWRVDGRPAGRGPSFRFVAPPAAIGTAHVIAVEVADRTGLKATPVSWKLEVTPRLTEVNVRDWLGRLAAAWERRDLATLRLFGIVTNDTEAEALRGRLPHRDHRVVIAPEAIRTTGRHATVTAVRAELDARGAVVSSARETYELEKQPSGFVSVRRASAR